MTLEWYSLLGIILGGVFLLSLLCFNSCRRSWNRGRSGASERLSAGLAKRNLTQFTVAAQGHRLAAYERKQAGAEAADYPLVLLLHGFPEVAFSWRQVLEQGVPGHRLVAIDMPGYGLSEPKETKIESYKVENLVDIIAAAIRVLSPNKPIVLVGHDWGGALTYLICEAHPDLIQRAVALNCAHPAILLQEATEKGGGSFPPVITELYFRSRGGASMKSIFTSPKTGLKRAKLDAEEIEVYRDMICIPHAATCALNYYRALMKYKINRSSQLTVPITILYGLNDAFIKLESIQATVAKYPNLISLQTLENCSHWTQQDAPDDVLRVIMEGQGSKV